MRVSACSADGFWSKSTDLGQRKNHGVIAPPLATPLFEGPPSTSGASELRPHIGLLGIPGTNFIIHDAQRAYSWKSVTS